VISGIHLFAPYILGTLRAAKKEIPKDISFITMGDAAWAAFYCPPITTVAFHSFNTGRAAVEYIFALIDGKGSAAELPEAVAEVKPELVIRESCQPLHKA
jgi:DNA-binding LacI/PurR family transcriptional regulator